MSGLKSRNKGKRGERKTAQELAAVFGDAKRGLSQSRSGSEVPDVVLPEGVPLWVECKSGKRINIKAALGQASLAAMTRSIDDGHLDCQWKPLAICRQDREAPTATMWWSDLAEIMREWHSLKQQAAHLAAALDEVVSQAEKRGKCATAAHREVA